MSIKSRPKKTKQNANQTIPLRKTLNALQSLDILVRTLERPSPIESSSTVLVIIIIFVLVVFFDIRRRSRVDLVVIAPIKHTGIGIRRM
jgi:hypothetical protein